MTASLLLQMAQALDSIFDRVDHLLKDDLLCDMLECLAAQPAPMHQRPMASSAIDPAVPAQQGKQLLALAAKIVRRRLAGPHQIARRFMSLVRRPHARQFAAPIKPRQRDRVGWS
jgi:hypothetical protein